MAAERNSSVETPTVSCRNGAYRLQTFLCRTIVEHVGQTLLQSGERRQGVCVFALDSLINYFVER
jgi:hypothetical protein